MLKGVYKDLMDFTIEKLYNYWLKKYIKTFISPKIENDTTNTKQCTES